MSPPFLADTSSALAITEEPYIVFVPLVSGSHLLVSALPEEFLDVWFFWEMTDLFMLPYLRLVCPLAAVSGADY